MDVIVIVRDIFILNSKQLDKMTNKYKVEKEKKSKRFELEKALLRWMKAEEYILPL